MPLFASAKTDYGYIILNFLKAVHLIRNYVNAIWPKGIFERDRQTDRLTERQRETETESDRNRDCSRERETERETERGRQRGTERERVD